jgi:hypothetical protein
VSPRHKAAYSGGLLFFLAGGLGVWLNLELWGMPASRPESWAPIALALSGVGLGIWGLATFLPDEEGR